MKIEALTFKRPDLSAPRYRPSYLSLVNSDFFRKVRRTYKDLPDAFMKTIIHAYGAIVQEIVIAEKDGVALPEQLGYLFIASVPDLQKGNIDFKKSIELGRVVRHENSHTNGLTAKIFYTNYGTKYRFKHRDVWKFAPVRQFKRTVAGTYPSCYERYIEVDRSIKVSALKRTPVKHKDVVNEVAARMNVPLQIVSFILDLYFKELHHALTTLRHPRIQVLNLGTFELRANQINTAIKRCSTLFNKVKDTVAKERLLMEINQLKHGLQMIESEQILRKSINTICH